MTTILILGGTGAMGIYLVEFLNKKGIKCIVTTRKHKANHENIEYVQGNAMDGTFLIPLLQSRHWSAVIDFMSYKTETFAHRLPVLLENTDQLIYLSSARVYAESNKPITEDSPRLLDVCPDKEYTSTDEYALAKARQENLLRQSEKRNWTIIRPYITFSDYRLQLSSLEKEYWLNRALNGKTIVFSKDLAEKTTTFTYGGDVARGIAAIIGKEEALGESFHITSSKSYKWREILETYLTAIEEKTGRKPNVLFTDQWQDYYGGGKWQVKYDRLFDRTFDNSKINRFIDISTFSDTQQALSNCVMSFIDSPKFLRIDWKSEAKKDSLTGEWTNPIKIPGWKQKAKYLLYRLKICDRR